MRESAGDLERLQQLPLTRRQLLRAGVTAPLAAAFLAACSSSSATPTAGSAAASGAAPSAAPASSAAASAAENFAGINLVVDTRSGSFDDTGTFKTAKQSWEARTGGKVTFNVFSQFNDFDTKYAGYITTKDPTVDVLYTYDAFNQTYGPRLFEDITSLAGDTSDFVPYDLKTFVTPDGKLRALPAQAGHVP